MGTSEADSFAVDRRRERAETRFPTNEFAELIVLTAPFTRLSGEVRNISRSGMRLELPTSLAIGTRVEVALPGSIILGEVRHCKQVGSRFSVGILIRDLYARTPGDLWHISDKDIQLFALGERLTSDALARVRQHLGICEYCCQRLLEAIRLFRRDSDATVA